MADFKVSQLPVATEMVDGDFLIINKGNTDTSRISFENIKGGGTAGGLDGRYVVLDGADDVAQTITGTGGLKTSGLLEGGGGVKVGSGDAADVVNGLSTNIAESTIRIIAGGESRLSIDDDGPIDVYSGSLKTAFRVNGGKNADMDGTSANVYSQYITEKAQSIINGVRSNVNFKHNITTYNGFASRGNLIDDGGFPTVNTFNHYTCDNNNFAEGVYNATCYNTGILNLKANPDNVTQSSAYGFVSSIDSQSGLLSDGVTPAFNKFNFFASGGSPNFFKGSTYIGGTTARNTFDLWKSTLTEEQLEQLEAGTLAAPANVSTPGDGTFARAWYYDQQDEETQALLGGGELEYPTHLAAATFTDTFALGTTTNINLNSNGSASFGGNVGIGLKNPAAPLHVDGTIYIGTPEPDEDTNNYIAVSAIADQSDAGRAAINLGTQGKNSFIDFTTNDYGNTRSIRMRIGHDGTIVTGVNAPTDPKVIISPSGLGEFKRAASRLVAVLLQSLALESTTLQQ